MRMAGTVKYFIYECENVSWKVIGSAPTFTLNNTGGDSEAPGRDSTLSTTGVAGVAASSATVVVVELH